jgi:hypothetical protein
MGAETHQHVARRCAGWCTTRESAETQAGRLFSSPPVHPCRGGVYNENQAGLCASRWRTRSAPRQKSSVCQQCRFQPGEISLSRHTQQQRASQAASSGPIPGRLCATVPVLLVPRTYTHTHTSSPAAHPSQVRVSAHEQWRIPPKR